MRKIRGYSIQALGVDHPQYFQGAGVAFTEWTEVSVGVGENAKEAFADAVEGLASSDADWDLAKFPTRPRGIRRSDSVSAAHPDLPEDSELQFYVAVYVK